jgi:hypothetical protein
VYPQPDIAQLVNDRFVPVRVHVKNDDAGAQRHDEALP